ncbi:GNAT family N-acetyltransferase [Georgenia satyanarayanai]|uniref:GNAT family N-acetyltransferase n=1 Tax=Georgenia satyanarayanai TaxID=860221 RepID=UPI001265246D|nr:GNAT family N-acetyltransferase [Georgenia satyanarayanai]
MSPASLPSAAPRPAAAPVSSARSTWAVGREDDFDFGSVEYGDLHARAGSPPFQHGVWLSELYGVLAPRRHARKVVVTVRDADGHLVLVLPLVRVRNGPVRVLEHANLGVSDYAEPVVDPREAAALLGDRAVARQVRAALGGFDLLRVAHVPDSPDVFLSMLAGARAVRHHYRTHVIDLPGTVEEWQAALEPGFARQLSRRYKRLRPRGEHRLRVVDDPADVEPVMSRMRQFRAVRFGERGGVDLVQDPDCFAFYCAVARRSLGNGPGRLVTLDVAGEPVVVVLGLANVTTELYVLVGYDLERFRNVSLGLVIVAELARAAIGRGQRQLDLTVGDEPYKADFGARSRPLYEVRVSRTPLGAAAALLRDGNLRARRLAKAVARRVELGRAGGRTSVTAGTPAAKGRR